MNDDDDVDQSSTNRKKVFFNRNRESMKLNFPSYKRAHPNDHMQKITAKSAPKGHDKVWCVYVCTILPIFCLFYGILTSIFHQTETCAIEEIQFCTQSRVTTSLNWWWCWCTCTFWGDTQRVGWYLSTHVKCLCGACIQKLQASFYFGKIKGGVKYYYKCDCDTQN